MGTPVHVEEVLPLRANLRLYAPPGSGTQGAFWRINGYRAKLVIWTVDEWEKLERRPVDAQFHPSGVWCALRLD